MDPRLYLDKETDDAAPAGPPCDPAYAWAREYIELLRSSPRPAPEEAESAETIDQWRALGLPPHEAAMWAVTGCTPRRAAPWVLDPVAPMTPELFVEAGGHMANLLVGWRFSRSEELRVRVKHLLGECDCPSRV